MSPRSPARSLHRLGHATFKGRRRAPTLTLDETLQARQEWIDEIHRLEPGQTALLIVDMQRGILEPGAATEVPIGRAIVPNFRRLIESCRQRQVPVIFTQFVYATAVSCLRGDPFGPKHLPCRPGETTGFGRTTGNCLVLPEADPRPDSGEIVPELTPRPEELVLHGHTYDKFYGTPLDLALRRRVAGTWKIPDIPDSGVVAVLRSGPSAMA